jgi:hypothetical protein
MDLYESIVNKLSEVNAVQLVRGTDVESYCHQADAYRWVNRRNGVEQYLQQWQLAQLISRIPHESRKKGSMLVVTVINPDIRAE